MNKYYPCIFLYSIILFGCSKNNHNSNENFIRNDYVFTELPDKCFELDENTTQNSSYFQYIQKKDSSIFAFINDYDNSITINDFKTGKLIKKISFQKEGANAVGQIQNFYLKDTLVYIHKHWGNTVFTTDLNSIVKDKTVIDLDIYRTKGINPPAILPGPLRALNIINNNLILSGFTVEQEGENSENTPSLVLYNLKNKTIRFLNSFPQLYHKGNWGINPTYRFISYTINNNNEIVLSYPADGYIYVNNLSGQINKYYAGVKNGEKGLKPISYKRNSRITAEEDEEYYMKNVVYVGIFYDQYENIYYRIVTLPTEVDNMKKSNQYNKKIQIIALDSIFNIIGRYNLKDDIYISGLSFLSNEGLHIKTNSENDDIMRFKTFKICKK